MQPLSTQILQQEGFIHSPRQLDGELGKRFQFLNKLGEGAFGVVFAALDKRTNKRIAIKKIKMGTKQQGIPAFAIREIAILKSLKHPHIVKITDVFYDYELPQLCFAMQYHPRTLYDLIKQRNPLSISQIKSFSYQILLTVDYLHQKGIIHRDLKPQNFLISEVETLHLCDFGQAKYTFYKPQAHTSDISTLWYRAPQILMGSELYDEKIDVWAVGCIIAEMIMGKPLFLATSQIALLFSIFGLLGTPTIEDYPDIKAMKDLSSTYPKFHGQGIHIEGVPIQILDILGKMLVVNPSKRISICQALRHQFLMGFDYGKKE